MSCELARELKLENGIRFRQHELAGIMAKGLIYAEYWGKFDGVIGDKIILRNLADCRDEVKTYSFSCADFYSAIEIAIENEIWDGDLDTLDYETADAIIQIACFEEVVFAR